MAGLGEERRGAAPHAGQPQEAAGDPPVGELAVALRLLDAPYDEAGARERPEVCVERVHVLVDAEALLLCLVGDVGRGAERARALVQRAHPAALAGDARHLAHHRRQVERMVQRGDAVRDVERLRGEGEVLAVGLDAAERADPLLVERAAAEPDHRVGEDVRRHVLAAERHEVLRRPCLRRSHLEHAHAGTHVAIEQQRERVLRRAPVLVVPAEVAVEVRQMRVDLVVGLVPALRLRHRRPALDLAPLGLDARQAVVEHPRHAVLDREDGAAAMQPSAAPSSSSEPPQTGQRSSSSSVGVTGTAYSVPERTATHVLNSSSLPFSP